MRKFSFAKLEKKQLSAPIFFNNNSQFLTNSGVMQLMSGFSYLI